MTTSEAPARSYCDKVLDVLRLFNDCRGVVQFETRSLGGLAHEMPGARPPFPVLPPVVLDALEQGDSVRIAAATTDGGRPADLAFTYVLFKLPVTIDRNSRSVVDPAAQEKIREALAAARARAAFPLPAAFILDGAHEVVAVWPLRDPLAVDRNDARAGTLLVTLAEKLGGEVEAANPGAFLPLAGVVRNFGMLPTVPSIEIEIGDAAARYTADEIADALSPPSSPDRLETSRKRGRTS